MPQIYISYRPDDSATIAGRIYNHLVRKFGDDNVFKDTFDIRPGDDFRGKIRENVAKCDVLLVIIGAKWLAMTESYQSSTRPSNDDWVSIEIETGLQRGVRVVPVLVQGASMPKPDQLPDSIREFAFKSKIEVREDPDFQNDIKRLASGLVDPASKPTPRTPQTQNKSGISNEVKVALIGLVGIIGAAVIAIVPSLINQHQTTSTLVPSPTVAVVSTSTPSAGSIAQIGLSPTPFSTVSTTMENTPQSQPATQPVVPGGNVELSLIASEKSVILYVPQSTNLNGLQLTAFINNAATSFLLTDYFPALKLASGIALADTCFVITLQGGSERLPLTCNAAVDAGRVFKYEISDSDRFWYDSVRNQQRDLAIFKDGKPTGVVCPSSQPTCKISLAL